MASNTHPELSEPSGTKQNRQQSTSKGYTLNSTFLNLKSSSLRGVPFPNIFNWLKVKRHDDNLGPYWRVHNKLYDLNDFIAKHPGGADWLQFTKGIDITEAFEASHICSFPKVQQILAKYYVKDIESPRNSPYTFDDNGFYRTLKRRADPVLQQVGSGSTSKILMIQDSLAITYLILASLGIATSSRSLQMLAGFALGMCSIGGHNFLHKADNWRQYYLDLCPLSSFEFRITHAFSHHLYPNTVLDFEVLIAEPLIKWLPNSTKNVIQKYLAPCYFYFLYSIFMLTQLIGRIISLVNGWQKLRWENLIVLLELGAILTFAPTIWMGLTSFLLIVMTASFWFVFVGFAHHHPNTFHDGDEPRPEPDFGLCQLDATMGKTDWFHKPLISVLVTFGEHPFHHLFPTVCHSKLEYLKPMVYQTLQEFGEDLPKASQLELFLGAQVQMGRTKGNTWKGRKINRKLMNG
ncbi:hypothetical protein HA402_014395 [Bradysia odoriphaga]|nr:hypothetical protein HA402_014395 [Bradysia odoriphaga]